MGPETICAGGDPAHFERRIGDFLRREARRDLEMAVRRHAATIGRAPIALSLRDTSSRWGSCSAKGALNFSWRLILRRPSSSIISPRTKRRICVITTIRTNSGR